jgi:hypothetical protein
MEILKDPSISVLIDLQKAFLKAALEKNGDFIEENVQKDFIFTSPRTVVLNKEGFIKTFVLNPDIRFEVFQSSDEKVVIAGDTGVVNCLVQARPANQADLWERVTFTFVNEAGGWMILTMHATFIPEKK